MGPSLPLQHSVFCFILCPMHPICSVLMLPTQCTVKKKHLVHFASSFRNSFFKLYFLSQLCETTAFTESALGLGPAAEFLHGETLSWFV